MKAIIRDNKVIATALDSYTTQGWEQDVLVCSESMTSENMGDWVYSDGVLVYPAGDLVRTKRNTLLADSDWTQVSDAPVNKILWATYRQALRDITNHVNFPYLNDADWPTKP